MLLNSDHHHQPGSPPQRGTRRAHSAGPGAYAGPDSSSEGESGPTQYIPTTKSPGTRRHVKRGRATSPLLTTNLALFDTPPSPTPVHIGLSEPFTDVFTQNATIHTAGGIPFPKVDHFERLEALLDSVLATAAILAPTRPTYSDHVRDALRTLVDLIEPLKAPPHAASEATSTPFTFAQAVASTKPKPARRPKPFSHKTTQHRHHTATSVQPSSESHHEPTRRLVIRWASKHRPERLSTATINHTIVKALADSSGWPDTAIAGVHWSRSGNLIVHTRAPYTAAQLEALSTTFISQLMQLLGVEEIPFVEPDVHWGGIVVHGLPVDEIRTPGIVGIPSLRDLLVKEMDLEDFQLKEARVLCRDEEIERRDVISCCLMFADEQFILRALREGIKIFGTHCRVSRYRPRTKRRDGGDTRGRVHPTR